MAVDSIGIYFRCCGHGWSLTVKQTPTALAAGEVCLPGFKITLAQARPFALRKRDRWRHVRSGWTAKDHDERTIANHALLPQAVVRWLSLSGHVEALGPEWHLYLR